MTPPPPRLSRDIDGTFRLRPTFQKTKVLGLWIVVVASGIAASIAVGDFGLAGFLVAVMVFVLATVSLPARRAELRLESGAITYRGVLRERQLGLASEVRVISLRRRDPSRTFAVQFWLGAGRRLHLPDQMWPTDHLEAFAAAAGIVPTSDPEELTVQEITRRYPGTYARIFALPPIVGGVLLAVMLIAVGMGLDAAISALP